jgi:hypothetical protein
VVPASRGRNARACVEPVKKILLSLFKLLELFFCFTIFNIPYGTHASHHTAHSMAPYSPPATHARDLSSDYTFQDCILSMCLMTPLRFGLAGLNALPGAGHFVEFVTNFIKFPWCAS